MKIRYGDRTYDPAKLRRTGKTFGWWRLGRHKPQVLEYQTNLDGTRKKLNHYITRYLRNPIYIKHAIQYLFGSFYRTIFGIFDFWSVSKDKELTEDLDKYLRDLEATGSYWIRGATANQIIPFKGWEWESGGNLRPRYTKKNHMNKFKVAPNRQLWIRYDDIEKKVDIEFWSEERWGYKLVETTPQIFKDDIVPYIELRPNSLAFRDTGYRHHGKNL